jgi:hypothetical protein
MNTIVSLRSRTLLALAVALALSGCGKEGEQATTATDAASATTTPPATAATVAEPVDLAFKPAVGAVDPTDESVKATEDRLKASAKAAREKWRGKTFEEFEASVFKEPGENGKYIVSGDIAIADRKHLREFFDKLQQQDDGVAHGKLSVRGLSINTVNGGVDAWSSTRKKQLTYCVSNSFGARKPKVIADMAAATAAWEEASDVKFTHVTAQDANCTATNQNVLFDVNPVDVDGEYLARAFFPSDQRADRNVLIDNSGFSLDNEPKLRLVGILRHELGHVLGWRHEHTRPEAGECFEDSEFKPLTNYDRFSVMHYPQCNGGGDWSLTLTGLDKAGAACMYGKGTNNTEDLGQCVYHAPDVPVTGAQETKVFDNQSVDKGVSKRHGEYAVKPGSIVKVVMTGVGGNAGDPDLYVRFLGFPTMTRWNCRPYTSGANETCELEVPANRNSIFVMVHGYAAGAYKLEITYTKP